MAIVKILSRHNPSYGSLLKYIMQDGKNGKPEIFTHNLRSNTLEGYVKEFMENESFRKLSRSDQVFLFHEILSFNAKEDGNKITPEIMDDIAKEYMRLRGNEGVMLGAVHRDKDHIHLHLCVSALKFRTGTSFRLSKSELLKLKEDVQKYHKEKYPFLSQSLPKHGIFTPYQKHEKWHLAKREQRTNLKEQLSVVVKDSLTARTQAEFLEMLRDRGYHHYERNGKATGIEVDGLRVRFSRIMDVNQFEALPVEADKAQTVLQEISAIREERINKDRDLDHEHER